MLPLPENRATEMIIDIVKGLWALIDDSEVANILYDGASIQEIIKGKHGLTSITTMIIFGGNHGMTDDEFREILKSIIKDNSSVK